MSDIPGCQDPNLCYNGGVCSNGGVCKCPKGFNGSRCEETTCDSALALSRKTGRCIDVDQFLFKGETPSIQWRPNLKNPGHDVFVNEALKLELFMSHLLNATLVNFVETKVIKFNYMARGVTFKMRVRLKENTAGSDKVNWYRWIKRAIDYSNESQAPGGRKIYINPESVDVMDENECETSLLNMCHVDAECHNELGGYTCHCNPYYVDNSTRHNLRPGTDCINPCSSNQTTNPCQNNGICVPAYQALEPICLCEFGFSGERCEQSAESYVLVLSLWGLVALALISTTSIIIYQCLAKRRDANPLLKYNITR